MNTSLKNARIFDEDYWKDEERRYESITIKTEPVTLETTADCVTIKKEENIPIKKEEDTCNFDNVFANQTIDISIKEEPDDGIDAFNVRQDPENTDSGQGPSNGSLSRKSTKKTVFQRDLPYESPQKPEQGVFLADIKKPKLVTNETARIKRKKEYESDPIVLARRQKQIDFGKNTIGYDQYVSTVPKRNRSPSDPVTPNKYLKYSRRAWDGLIKQWRLKLHKYDL